MATSPMFPLGSVLLPGMVLPLHVFEPRYRALVRDCLAADREFGVTLIERGSEVGGGDIRAMAGTMAEIVRAEELDDGRWHLVAVGLRRVRVREWAPDAPYPKAVVEDWPDAPAGEGAEEAARSRTADLRRLLAVAAELGMEAQPLVDISGDPTEASYQISILGPFGALDRQRLLTAPGPSERLALLGDLLEEQEVLLRARLSDG
ncbi:MAG: LON peptidase substrate-binding domain-containing protein [Acidimicrobiales bacterium]